MNLGIKAVADICGQIEKNIENLEIVRNLIEKLEAEFRRSVLLLREFKEKG